MDVVAVQRPGAEPFYLGEERVHVDDRPPATVLKDWQLADAPDVQEQGGLAHQIADLVPGATVDVARAAINVDDGDRGTLGRDELSNLP